MTDESTRNNFDWHARNIGALKIAFRRLLKRLDSVCPEIQSELAGEIRQMGEDLQAFPSLESNSLSQELTSFSEFLKG